MRLAEALEQTATGVLRRVASAHGLAHDDSTTRAELLSLLGQRLADATYLQEQLAALSEDEHAILSSAHASAGELRGQLIDLDYPGTAESLAERGWLYRVFAAAGPLRGEVFVVPDEVLSVVPVKSQSVEALSTTDPPPSERRATDPAFSLFAMVSAYARAGGHLEDEVRPWSEEPGGWGWDARWTFLRHLATSAALLVHRADGKLAPAASLPRLLDDPATLADRLHRTWMGDGGWSELTQAGLADEPGLVDALGLRRAMVDLADQLPASGWTQIDQFSAWLQRTRPLVVREQLNPRGLVRLQAMSWEELERPLLAAFLLGPLYWLGSIMASRDGRLVARRPASAHVAEQAREREPCRWDGAADLLAPARTQLGTLLQAERYLILRGRGRLSRYHLVQAHVAAALGSGGSIAECRQLLVRLTQAPLPASVEERLTTWDRRFGALEIRPAVLLESRVSQELEEVLDDERVRPFVRGRLGASAVEVAAADALELAAALRETGHLPRVDAALRLAAEPRRAYAGLVDEQVLEFLLVNLLAFQIGWPERLAELEGSVALLERLEHQFAPERLAQLRDDAARLAGTLSTVSAAPAARRARSPRRRKQPTRRKPRAT